MRTSDQSLLTLTLSTFLFVNPLEGLGTEKTISQIVEEQGRAVIYIVSIARGGKVLAQGSGFLVRPDGVFVTNFHVVENAAAVAIRLPDGRELQVTGLIAVKPEYDLAVLKVESGGLPVVPLGDSTTVKVGERVVAIGSPLGLENTVSEGIVSAIREENGYRIFQITAPVSPGSSGGPLFDMNGKVIGVTFLQITEGQNLNFAIPSSYLEPVLRQMQVKKFTTPVRAPGAEDCPVVGNRSSGIYHVPGGRFYGQMLASRNRVCFADEDEALRAGYRRSRR